jgi:hypothetical protein
MKAPACEGRSFHGIADKGEHSRRYSNARTGMDHRLSWMLAQMADPQILTTLRRKQSDIESAIVAYEKRIEEARRDLSAINAAIRLFSVETGAENVASYMDIYRLFKRGEQIAICKGSWR